VTLRDQLLRDEGVRLKVYQDSEGVPTIGVGRNLRDRGISLTEAEMLLDNDIAAVRAEVLANIPWSRGMDEVRRAVLENMCFNLGLKGLLGFTKTLAAMEDGNWYVAAAHMMESRWAKQVGIRAERLSEQLRSGEWQ
jgi:lysozyme